MCSHKVSNFRLCKSFGIQCCLYWQRKNSERSEEKLKRSIEVLLMQLKL